MKFIKKVFGVPSLMALATVTAFGSGRSNHSSVSITSPSTLPSGVVSTFYSTSLTATGGTTPYTWAVIGCSGACNSGLGFINSGILSGMPANAGTSTFTFGVTDARGRTASAVMNIAIASANTPAPAPTPAPTPTALAITSSGSLPSGAASSSYTASLSATGGTTPYNWAINGCSGVCNAGLSLSPTGVFSGTPVNSGTSTYSVGVIDATGQAASASLNLTIAAAAPTPNSTTANYFVSPSGSDSNPCSQSSPCATPDYAFNLASPGQTVSVAPGTYDYGSRAAVFSKSGTAGNYITVTCATRGACKIQNSLTGNTTVIAISGNYMTFDGFEVTNNSPAGNNLGLYVTSSFVNITRNTIHNIQGDCGFNGGGGITLQGSGSALGTGHDITMDSNLIYDINYTPSGGFRCGSSVVQFDGILAETGGANIIITNNIVYHVGGGWGLSSGGVGSVFANNLVFSNANGGITHGNDAGVISNNAVFNNGLVSGQCGIMLTPTNHMTVLNNDVYGNTGADYCIQWGAPISDPGTGDISVNPAGGTTFVNWQANGSGDYHEKAGSPTIGAGNSNLGPPPASDFDGNARQTPYDIGAYQHN